MRYLFLDPITPRPYTEASLLSPGLGGTEATCIRVAEALGDSLVMQHCRTQDEGRYLRPSWGVDAERIVVLRCARTALAARQHHKLRPIYLWMHDLVRRADAELVGKLEAADIELILVSEYHRLQLVEAVKQWCPELVKWPRMRVIHNPIADDLNPDNTQVMNNKLVFFSSPHKGLVQTLDAFQAIKRFKQDTELYIANPGYLPTPELDTPGVHVVGALPHAEALQHVRQASFVLYPNHVFPETFGLVFAEANAVGTPVLTHALGAAREVLGNPAQLIDTRNFNLLVDTAVHWLEGGRPVVGPNEAFRMHKVRALWATL